MLTQNDFIDIPEILCDCDYNDITYPSNSNPIFLNIPSLSLYGVAYYSENLTVFNFSNSHYPTYSDNEFMKSMPIGMVELLGKIYENFDPSITAIVSNFDSLILASELVNSAIAINYDDWYRVGTYAKEFEHGYYVYTRTGIDFIGDIPIDMNRLSQIGNIIEIGNN